MRSTLKKSVFHFAGKIKRISSFSGWGKPFGTLNFQCNVCGNENTVPAADLGRETPTCLCGSTVRSRSIIHMLSMELFGKSIALPDFPVRHDISGWGMSDAGYVDVLSKKLGYLNTFYDREPHFDITTPIKPEQVGSLDFLISTEVFEHIEPPVSIAFENAKKLLSPKGVLIFTVPFVPFGETKEHFPELHQYEFMKQPDGNLILKNITKDGREQIFKDLVFHGGVGSTLEMRVFSKDGIIKELEQAGFGNVKFYSEPCWEHGIYWSSLYSVPLTARPLG